jgi:vanillate/3-O-methylgallate O-demethylase
VSDSFVRREYLRANNHRGTAFIDRPYIGSPGAPAQAETNASMIWGHMLGGFLFGYEYTRWWKESKALRNTAVLGDWSWLHKVSVKGRDAAKFMAYISVKDLVQQHVGQVIFAPMVNDDGKVTVEGLSLRLGENEFLYTAGGAETYFPLMKSKTSFDVTVEDVTPDYTCFALQGPHATEILEGLTQQQFKDLRFSRWRKTRILDEDVIVARQGVTGEVGYEFYIRTDTGKAHELWRTIRQCGEGYGLRELGLKAQLIGHTETGIATSMRDYLPARGSSVPSENKLVGRWSSREELALLGDDLSPHFCSPAELGWSHTVDLERGEFVGQTALLREAQQGGPRRRFVGLMWNSEDMARLYARLFEDEPSAPPPDLPYGQMRVCFLRIVQGGKQVGWASGATYSPNLRRMISLGRIDRDLSAPGQEVSVIWGNFADEPTMEIKARVHELPFIRQRRRDDLTAAHVTRRHAQSE